MSKPAIVILDGYTVNPGDLNWSALAAMASLKIYDHSTPDQVIERSKNARILVINKTQITADIIASLPELECICLLATGYNNIDITAASKRGIPVCNVAGYSTPAVAQHVFALLLSLTNHVAINHQSVQNGKWSACRDFSFSALPIIELQGLTMGIYGLGKIGMATAAIAKAFGMKVIANKRNQSSFTHDWIDLVELDQLFSESDVISLHANLSEQNEGIINSANLANMKSTAFLINTSRGGLINESDLKQALETNQIAGAALDVLSQEPPVNSNILFGVKNCLITPHNAWASKASRTRLIAAVTANVAAFLAGAPQHVVNLKE